MENKIKFINIFFLTTTLLIGCSQEKNNNDFKKENIKNNLNSISKDTIKVESLNDLKQPESVNYKSIMPDLKAGWESQNIKKTLIKSITIKHNYVIINDETPNLYRVSLKVKKPIQYLMIKNGIKDENLVLKGQKIYYD